MNTIAAPLPRWAIIGFVFSLLAVKAHDANAQARDSTVRGDSMSMPGMGGMKMPATKKPAQKKPAPRPAKRRPSARSKTTPAKPAPTAPTISRPDTMTKSGESRMTMSDPLGVSMGRLGSGTTWIPDAVSLPSRHFMKGAWDVMFHGFVFGQYDHQSGPRGDDQIGSLNWGMLMGSRELARGRFQLRAMLSLDAATVTKRGYPLLLQSGETYRGEPLHDRQHPHDFWMELAAMYERPITGHLGFTVYAAPSGEPALGPVAFMHRPSAMDNPTAPLAHHWQDATHVSFGVITAGLFTHDWKLEASAFNGREPDENRWNFDPLRLDSYSARLTFNPTVTWSLSAGYGYLKSPELLNPDESMHRITASALHGISLGKDGQVSSAIVWGANEHSSTRDFTHSLTGESEAILDDRHTILGRVEWVQKTAEDLVLDNPPSNFASSRIFNVGAISVGYIREIFRDRGATLGLGGMGTVNIVPTELENPYGSRHPTGIMIFARLRPYYQRDQMKPMRPMKMAGR